MHLPIGFILDWRHQVQRNAKSPNHIRILIVSLQRRIVKCLVLFPIYLRILLWLQMHTVPHVLEDYGSNSGPRSILFCNSHDSAVITKSRPVVLHLQLLARKHDISRYPPPFDLFNKSQSKVDLLLLNDLHLLSFPHNPKRPPPQSPKNLQLPVHLLVLPQRSAGGPS